MSYPHRLRVTRAAASGGVQDPDTGAWVPSAGGEQVLYDGQADVQDVGEARPRNAVGMPQLESEASAFLADERPLFDIEPGDAAEVFYPNGRTADAEVKFAREIDGSLLLRFL